MRWKALPLVCVIWMMFACSSPDKKSTDATDGGITVLTPKVFNENLSAASNPILIDVRTPEEIQEGIIPTAVNMNIKDSTFTDQIKKLDKNNAYFLYCKSGKRSSDAAKQMEDMGFKNISVLDGGIVEWEAKRLGTVKPE